MRALLASELMSLWERGQVCQPADRALMCLAAATGSPLEELRRLPVGERDARLLTLRELTFGPELAGLATCHACGGGVEFSFDASDVRAPSAGASSAGPFTTPEYELRFRLPDTADLQVIANAPDPPHGRRVLIERCVSAVDRSGAAVAIDTVPDDVLTAVVERIAQADPQADVQIALTCPACAHQWEAAFDIAMFFWNELQAHARRLLRDVDQLARAYGWREADILAMSAFRREAYLELLNE